MLQLILAIVAIVVGLLAITSTVPFENALKNTQSYVPSWAYDLASWSIDNRRWLGVVLIACTLGYLNRKLLGKAADRGLVSVGLKKGGRWLYSWQVPWKLNEAPPPRPKSASELLASGEWTISTRQPVTAERYAALVNRADTLLRAKVVTAEEFAGWKNDYSNWVDDVQRQLRIVPGESWVLMFTEIALVTLGQFPEAFNNEHRRLLSFLEKQRRFVREQHAKYA